MVLKASDELRHPWDDTQVWRESWYWNFSDPANEIGCWLYFWVLPNQPLKTGMLVSFYHGIQEEVDSNGLAFAAPGHLYKGPNGHWVYCYKTDIPGLIPEDVDDAGLGGFHMKVIEPLKHTRLTFEDPGNASFAFDCRYMTRPWDFADNLHETPPWLAKNRYHRGWQVDGQLTIGGKTYQVKTTGDSDHSWGARDMTIFGQNNLKTYAIQAPDGGLSVKAQLLGPAGREVPRGYIAVGEDMQAVKSIRESSRYTKGGVMHDITLRVEDVTGRVVEAHMDAMFGAVGGAGPRVGYEGAGLWDVKGYGKCAGLASCWFAEGVTREDLHEGRAGRTLEQA